MIAKEVLAKTRELFASTHWTQGALQTTTDDDEGNEKYIFCAVGGLRYIATGYAVDLPSCSSADYDTYVEALKALALSLELGGEDERVREEWLERLADTTSTWEAEQAVLQLEDLVIGWNDSYANLADVLNVFAAAEARA